MVIDSREQKPLLFPETIVLRGVRRKVTTVRRKLEAGDYCLEGTCGERPTPIPAIVERKGGIWEIQSNTLTKDRRRFRAAIKRLAKSCEYPVLLIESSINELTTVTKKVRMPWVPLQHLMDLAAEFDLRLIFVGRCRMSGARRKVGELVIRLLSSLDKAPKKK